ncbi:hypothetical protein SAMN05428960_3891 [Mitsuaria sp. PDC51]|uniref:hypothetical protein n=1 Tax=Mitsuaria sp. PDC51 TaxID=1881035 RepID=UPI0008EE9A84|nr:hypothetical protein [Mitsuaria sp. PDC51]SFR94965.1 hypothetical protein SAMN05428960_3891 [Mitsuaria sp. PDC51]
MSVSSRNLFTLARSLSTSTDEATLRAAISRAYYAAYHRCLDWERQLPRRGSDTGVHGVHACLISRLESPHRHCSPLQAQRSKAIGKQLREQRDRRTFADYSIHGHLPRQFVSAQLTSTADLLKQCDQSNGSPRSGKRRTR